jgi:hypothetical protein
LEDLEVDGRIILKWIFKKWDVRAWTGLIWFRIRTVAGACECGDEHLDFIKISYLAGNLLASQD